MEQVFNKNIPKMLFLFLIYLNRETDCKYQSRTIESSDIATLKFAQVVFRHGDRSPLENGQFPTDSHNEYWNLHGWGQLTEKGKKRMYDFGQFLRWRYDYFLSREFSEKEIFILSSGIERTIESVKHTLSGLYNDCFDCEESKKYPINVIPKEEDMLLRYELPCKRYKALIEKYLSSEFMQKINTENKQLYEFLTSYSGKNVTNIIGVGEIYDTLFVEENSGLSAPDWSKAVYPDKLKPLETLNFEALGFCPRMKLLRGGPLLKQLIFNMKHQVNRFGLLKDNPSFPFEIQENIVYNNNNVKIHPEAKIYLYSGHDTSIFSILKILDHKDINGAPPYSSSIFLELHQDKKTDPESFDEPPYYIKVFYRNDSSKPPFLLEIKGCKSDPCLLEDFYQLKKHLLADNWHKECEGYDLTEESIPEYNSLGAFQYWLILVFGLYVLSSLIYLFILPDKIKIKFLIIKKKLCSKKDKWSNGRV